MTKPNQGPLSGMKVIEFAGLGPAPFGVMQLADMGAEVLRIDRPGGYPSPAPGLSFEALGDRALFNRGRRTVRVNMKSPEGLALVKSLLGQADVLVEGFRPGTMEKLGLGPDVCHALNPRLIYGRMTGWGQTGPMAHMAGHDMNYIGLSGALSLFPYAGEGGIPPLVGDMPGGLYLVMGILAAYIHAKATGEGQVVDAAIADGAANLYALLSTLRMSGFHNAPAGGNLLDGGAHFYRTYKCADGESLIVGAIEPQFRKILLENLGLLGDEKFTSGRVEDDAYCTTVLRDLFLTQPRDHWVALFDGTDGCVTPVLSPEDAVEHPHNKARGTFQPIDGGMQQAPTPRFSATPAGVGENAGRAMQPDAQALQSWGCGDREIQALLASGVIE
ncbi:MAG: CaiB/BaiF CoA transferase family protein [Halocynthiibacter sp.]